MHSEVYGLRVNEKQTTSKYLACLSITMTRVGYIFPIEKIIAIIYALTNLGNSIQLPSYYFISVASSSQGKDDCSRLFHAEEQKREDFRG